ncbi:MAG: 50S ribosomal protein L21 [Candidatus Yanofskybacteria bacterium RIFCSPHIGHO2_02_FULL_41_11]|uniref:Large ribosomal subunit protein bL21 n=1 Tax=Candidatus Yanofskybacteria bacterium RIFCSPHIGHO2_02_FULL_41_11 TaxID=1802675 RepID=A0A1F8FAL5_9BACT|nr:MAG: 50S ribosomal protein L21 [Candidatus Yanofskybacteria bacterium RIFCSPHIGHO2_02_FULL_41_11]
MVFAVIKTGGKQYKVAEGDVLTVEKLPRVNSEEQIVFSEVLLIANGEVKVGRPTIPGAKVTAKILEEGKSKKKIVFRYKSKTRQHKKKGHRQPYTKVEILKITS